MSHNKSRIDWSERCWKEMLVYQRESAWLEDTLDKLAAWLGLQPGMTALDVGCGLGYLGYTYWPYFGAGGGYFGVDKSSKLLHEARKAAAEWAVGGETHFTAGDVYRLPFRDNLADCVICQTVLMHLERPDIALAEMIRVARPGGIVMCQEPDNLSSMMVNHFSSQPEFDLDEQLLLTKIAVICNKGRIKLGRGDNSIGTKIPRMMNKLGLIDIGIRLNDRVHYLEPPYEGSLQQHALEHVKKQWLDEERRRIWIERAKREFSVGGGTQEDFERYREIMDKRMDIFRQQIEEGTYFACSSGDFYIIKGRKPK
jgi:SAM-dependent methyltransferase